MKTMAESMTPGPQAPATVYEQILARGVPRREFLKFCAWMAACMGLGPDGLAQVVQALETQAPPAGGLAAFPRVHVLQRVVPAHVHPIVADILLDKLSLDYTETLMAASGHQAEACLHDTLQQIQRRIRAVYRRLRAAGG